MSQDTVTKPRSKNVPDTLTSSLSSSLNENNYPEAKQHKNSLPVLDREKITSQSMPLLYGHQYEKKQKNSIIDQDKTKLIDDDEYKNLSLSVYTNELNQQNEENKAKSSIIKKIFLFLIVPGVTFGVAIGEAAPVYYFISTDKSLQKLDSKLLLTLAILATVAAFILSLALFYQAMVDTVNNSGKIWKIIRHGKLKNKKGQIERYARWQRGVIILAFILSIFSAVAVGALAYNSITKAFPNISGIQGIGIAVFVFEVIATTAVNNFYFVNTLQAIFKKDTTNSLKGTGTVIKKWFSDTSKRVAGIRPEQKLNDASGFRKYILLPAFWLLLVGLCLSTAYVIFGLFKTHLMKLSFLSLPSSAAIACAATALIVLSVFRFKSIYQLLIYPIHKETRQKKSPHLRSIRHERSNYKKIAFFALNILILAGCLFAPALNSFGQALGALSVKGLLPIIILGAIGLSLASFSANSFAFIDTFAKRPSQKPLNENASISDLNEEDNQSNLIESNLDANKPIRSQSCSNLLKF